MVQRSAPNPAPVPPARREIPPWHQLWIGAELQGPGEETLPGKAAEEPPGSGAEGGRLSLANEPEQLAPAVPGRAAALPSACVCREGESPLSKMLGTCCGPKSIPEHAQGPSSSTEHAARDEALAGRAGSAVLRALPSSRSGDRGQPQAELFLVFEHGPRGKMQIYSGLAPTGRGGNKEQSPDSATEPRWICPTVKFRVWDVGQLTVPSRRNTQLCRNWGSHVGPGRRQLV